MLKTMRQNTKVILWILIIAFVGTIVFAWGMNVSGRRRVAGGDVVGVINGQKITLQQFYNAFQNLYAQAQEQLGQDIDLETFRRLRDETWNQMVTQILLAEEIKSRDIAVSDQELLYYIRTNPPAYLRDNESLQTDGKFDPQKYAAVLADPRYDWRPLEEQYRSIIPMQKLQDLISATVRVTEAEVLEEYKARNEKVKVRYLAFLPGDFQVDQSAISEEDLHRYYQEHQEDFHQARMANLDYIFVEKTPTQADEESTRAELNIVRERILAGEDFAELADAFSQGPSANQGGDLGFFGHGAMDSVFEAAAFSLQIGQISEPVRSAFGWHIIKLEERRQKDGQEEIRARHILLKVAPSQETLQALGNKMDELARRAEEVGLAKAASELNLETKQTGFFQEGSTFVPGLGRASDAALFAFAEKKGALGGPFENETGMYLVSVREKEEAGVPPLEKIKEQVQSAVLREKQREKALEKAKDFQRDMEQIGDLEQAAAAASLPLMETNAFSRRDYVPQIGRANEFIGTAFGLPEGTISGLVDTNRGYYILQVIGREGSDPDQFAEQKDALRLDLLRSKQNQAYTDWFEGIKARAKIEDYRDRFFRS